MSWLFFRFQRFGSKRIQFADETEKGKAKTPSVQEFTQTAGRANQVASNSSLHPPHPLLTFV